MKTGLLYPKFLVVCRHFDGREVGPSCGGMSGPRVPIEEYGLLGFTHCLARPLVVGVGGEPEEDGARQLRRFGYRHAYDDPVMYTRVYARTWVWPLVKLRRWWRPMYWLWRARLVHLSTASGHRQRWHDLRPGPGRKR